MYDFFEHCSKISQNGLSRKQFRTNQGRDDQRCLIATRSRQKRLLNVAGQVNKLYVVAAPMAAD